MLTTLFAAAIAMSSTVEIAPGVNMPRVNLGTCCGSKPLVGIPAWFAAGGTGLDTAFDYNDQADIAQALRASGRQRAEFFVTTKVPAGVGVLAGNTTDCSVDDESLVERYIEEDLRELGLDHVDLVLLHGPCRFGNASVVPDPTAADNALWRGMQRALKRGLTKSIGVSNYNSSELAALRGPRPAVNQCQMSVSTADTTLPMPRIAHDDATIAYCKQQGITYEAWRVLGGCPMTHPTVTSIALAHNASAAQICMAYVLQRGAIVASGTGADPAKAAEYSHENLASLALALTSDEMTSLSGISP